MRLWWLTMTLAAVVLMVTGFARVSADAPANPAFSRTWERTDGPVADRVVDRTWMWGPDAFTGLLYEDYTKSPNGRRIVQYFDKSRMEITEPDAVDDGVWYVSNGLLVIEMVEGFIQLGDTERDDSPSAAEVNIAGDAGQRPTYADIARFGLRDQPAREEGTVID